MLALTRRFLGGALIAVVAATSTAPHNHSLSELAGGLSPGTEQAVTTHDPHSRSSHWHAVIRFVKENPCLACQWHRLAGVSVVAGFASRIRSVSAATIAIRAMVRSTSFGQPSSRAPPGLL